MRALIIKTSSMGDIIHALPALTDAKGFPDIQFDWVVEAGFKDIPSWHPAVDRVIPTAIRAWRRQINSLATWRACRDFIRALRVRQYDAVIDAQGLIKSAVMTRLARGPRFGFDRYSARESLSAWGYQQAISVPRQQHAIARVRQLFAGALGYLVPQTEPVYGLEWPHRAAEDRYLVFFHGTTWDTKHWPEEYWVKLAQLAVQNGWGVKLPWGNATERARAERIATVGSTVQVLPKLSLTGIAEVLAGAGGAVSVDTGFGHLAAALGVQGVSLYGPTNPLLSGAVGPRQVHLMADFPCAPCLGRQCTFRGPIDEKLQPPCLATLSPEAVWAALN